MIGILVFLLLCVGLVYVLWQPALRIAVIEVQGLVDGDLLQVSDLTRRTMSGRYLGVIPRDSIIFFPENEIRSLILDQNNSIAAVSIYRRSLTGVVIDAVSRTPIGRWCGLSPTLNVEEYCYLFDANGLIYTVSTPTSPTVNAFVLYAPLEGDGLEPLRGQLRNSDKLPAVFDFARELASFGSHVKNVIIKDDEVSNVLKSGTRITHVLGNELNAYTALVAARVNLDLATGGLEYIDLRFDGKVYFKKKIDSLENSVNSL